MSGAIPFTDNYRDLSNGDGFQFEFHCERCGNGYRSEFKRSMRKTGGALLRGLGSLIGGRAQTLSSTADQMLNRGTNSPEKDAALRAAVAVAEIEPEFTQCRGCGDWVCEAVCWNPTAGQCVRCAPNLVDELSRIQAEARTTQLRERAAETDLTAGIDVGERALTMCPSCGARTAGGKFCVECGTSLATVQACGSCSAENPVGAKFCSQCGHGL